MRGISTSLKKVLQDDPFMSKCCIPNCPNPPEWEHCWTYARKQIGSKKSDWWALVGMCMPHHRGDQQQFVWGEEMRSTKKYGQWLSLCRGLELATKHYPKKDWHQKKRELDNLFLK